MEYKEEVQNLWAKVHDMDKEIAVNKSSLVDVKGDIKEIKTDLRDMKNDAKVSLRTNLATLTVVLVSIVGFIIQTLV